MNGAFLNALAILLGGLAGLVWRASLPARAQLFLRAGLGAATMITGICLVAGNWGGSFLLALKRLLITFLAVVFGYWLGKLLRLQDASNQLGRFAGQRLNDARIHPPGQPLTGLAACFILLGAAPLGWLGAVEEGFTGGIYLFAIKALMDALAMMGFVRLFGWVAALSAFPIFALFGAVTLLCQHMAAPYCLARHMADSVNSATGLVACAVSLVIFEVRRVELTSFLPAVVVAPLLEWLWR
jgi:uncharacterized membrane protein YqgA involved in biofilm formation